MTTKTLAYARTHTAAYVSDKIAGLMKRLVNAFGFDPRGVADAWTDWIDLAARHVDGKRTPNRFQDPISHAG